MITKFVQKVDQEELTHLRLIKQLLVGDTITLKSYNLETIISLFQQELWSPNLDSRVSNRHQLSLD